MNHIKSIFILFIGGLCLSLSGQAQTARWQIKPEYQSIEPFAENIYKAKTYNDVSLINTNGETLLKADSITYLNNGYALGLTSTTDKYKLTSIIDKNGQITKVSEDLYVGDYPFFSEDKCAVVNKRGKYGFITPDGKLAIKCNYVSVFPFREGLASVCKVKKGLKGFIGKSNGPTIYIDAKGIEKKLSSEIGVVAVGTSFHNGKAYVMNQDNKSFIIDQQGKVVQTNPDMSQLKEDDYAALISGTPEKANVPYKPNYNYAYTVFTEDGKSGYRANGVTMLPAQFQEAKGFSSGFAIVKKNDKYGLLQQIGGSPQISVTEKGGKLEAKGMLPAEWNNIRAYLVRIINKADKLSFEMEGLDSERTLSVEVPAASGEKRYEVEAEGLTIWRYKTGVVPGPTPDQPGKGVIALKAPAVVKANSKGECAVTVRVTNKTGAAQNITVSLSVGGSKSIKLAAGKTGSVTITTKVVRELKCTITAKCAGGSGATSTTLKPSFVL